MTTQSTVKALFTMPELQDDKLIEWNLHVTQDLGAHGHDYRTRHPRTTRSRHPILRPDGTMGTKCMPFKDQDATLANAYFINEDEMEEASAWIRRILDATYEAANIDDVCAQQEQLSQVEKDKLKRLLLRYEELLDGTLGKWKGAQSNYN